MALIATFSGISTALGTVISDALLSGTLLGSVTTLCVCSLLLLTWSRFSQGE